MRAHAVLAGIPLLWLAVAGVGAAAPADVADGRRIVEGQGVAPEHACRRCHGRLGTGRPAAEAPGLDIDVPRLAGQPRLYLTKQLEDFASGARPSPIMAPIARGLTPEQRYDAASYYASVREAPYPPQPAADPFLLQRGGALAAVGDPGRGVRACEVCHADAGVGFPPGFPYLAGQFAGYTERQLSLWKRGERRNDPLDVMGEIAGALSDEEIRAVALYFARVRPPWEAVSRPIPVEPVPRGGPSPDP